MKFAIFGTGGVGGYFGGRLAQAGHDVTFIARGKHLAAIEKTGLHVDSIVGDFVISPVKATNSPASVGPVDVVLVAVKTWQLPMAIGEMKPLVGQKTIIIPLLNGVEAPDQLSATLGRKHVLGGLCRISAFIAEPGHIRHVSIQPYIAFGELDNRKSKRVQEVLHAFFKAPHVEAEVPDDIQTAIWEKFIFICTVSGIGAVTRQSVGDYRAIPETRSLLEKVLSETIAVGRARGVKLNPDVKEKILTNLIDQIPSGTMASMQKDIMEGRPSELEAQNGAVVRLGREAGIPTPANAFIYGSLLPMELKARGKI